MNTITVFSVINTASFSFGAILVCLTCLVYMVLRGRFEKSQSKLFLTLVVILLVNAVCSMTAEVLKGYVLVSNTAVVGVRVSNYAYFIAHTMLAPMVCVYFLVVCGRAMKWRSASNMILLLPFAVAELAVVVNPITGWVYYYGPENVGSPYLGPEAFANRATIEECKGLPPIVMNVGESDMERDYVLDFARKCYAARVPCSVHVWQGCGHGSLWFTTEGECRMADRFWNNFYGDIMDCFEYDMRRPWAWDAEKENHVGETVQA